MTRIPYLPYPDLPDLTERRVELLSIRHALSIVAGMVPQRTIPQTVEAMEAIIDLLIDYDKRNPREKAQEVRKGSKRQGSTSQSIGGLPGPL